MNQSILLKTIRKFALSPILVYSIYLVVIYSNDFWLKMIGSSHLALSICLLISSGAAIYFSIRVFGEKNQRSEKKPLYYLFSIISFLFSISLIYYTRDIKTMECVYWINIFLNTNKNTFFVSCFNQLYDTYSIMNIFVHTRIIHVHDSLICITIITFIVYISFTFAFQKVVKINEKVKKEKLIKNETNASPLQTENNNTNSIDDNEDHSYSFHNDNPFSPTNLNTSTQQVDPPWVLPPSSDSETPLPQQPWVLPPSDQEDPIPQSQPQPQPQPQPQSQPQLQPQPTGVPQYEYEYEYEYDE
ncbi:hypothetical protein M9Y10_022269 [Tritrichomonas musculus]|uniref:Uncharacterized protein n=1 Tax=Tritrichomonas musculus TaxID=1915356 RepID=A0ABR2KV41_9EUKA